MSSTGTRTIRRIVADRKFDPRAVVAGVVVLLLLGIGATVMFSHSSQQADEVAAPVAAICRQGGPAAVQLANTPACQAAGNIETGVGPYQSEANPTVQGARGIPGTPGAAGQPGTGIPGQPGVAGQPGTAGTNGTNGVAGEPGASIDGPTGAQGEPGETVTGPQGPAGKSVVGPEGPAGPVGPAGESIVGPQGPAGANGSPAAQQTFATDDGRIFSCARTGGTDMSPMYRCVEQTPEAVPTP